MIVNRRDALGLAAATAAFTVAARAADSKPKRVIVTGHRGNIGHRLMKPLADAGYDVVGIDKQDGFEWDLASITGEMREITKDADVFIHLTTAPGGDRATDADLRSDVIQAFHNVSELARLAQWEKRGQAESAAGLMRVPPWNGPHLIFASSNWAAPGLYRHGIDSIKPVNRYGWSKLYVENRLIKAGAYDLGHGGGHPAIPATIVRIGWVPPEGTPRPDPSNWTSKFYHSTDEIVGTFVDLCGLERTGTVMIEMVPRK